MRAGSSTRWIVLALVVTVSGTARPLAAQELDQAVARLVRAWGAGDAGALETLLAPSVHLDLDGEEHLGVSPRQVSASLERLFRRFRPREPVVSRSGDLERARDRGFAELSWSPSGAGETGPVTHLLFVGFRRLPEGWRITELRILR